MKKLLSHRLAVNPQFGSPFGFGIACFRQSRPCFQFSLWGVLKKQFVSSIICLLSFSASLNAESIIKFREINGYLVVVSVRIDGKGPFDFIVDTGADDIAIDLGLVKELGIKPTTTVMLVTLAGSQEVPAGYPLRNMQLGSRNVPEVKALAMNLAALKPHKIRGIVGQSLLSQFDFLLDFKRHEMIIEENFEISRRLVQSSRFLELQKLEGRWFIRVSRKAGKALKLVLDAGADQLIMYDSKNLGLDIDNGSIRSVQVTTNLGTRELRAARLRHFEVGGVELQNQMVVLSKNGTGDEERPEDGLLPARLFNAVYFNNTRKRVLLNPEFTQPAQMASW